MMFWGRAVSYNLEIHFKLSVELIWDLILGALLSHIDMLISSLLVLW